MKQLYYIKKGRLEWREQNQLNFSSKLEALVRPIAAARCDLDEAMLFQDLPLKLSLGNIFGKTDPDSRKAFGRNFFRGPFPFGHECIAEVIEVSEGVRNFRKGDVVVVPFQISCGACIQCLNGMTSSCGNTPTLSTYGFGKHLQFGGAVADQLIIPYADAMLIKVPSSINYIHLASLGDNVADAYGRVAPYIEKNAQLKTLIIGGIAQSVGLYAVLIAKAMGCPQVHYADENFERLNTAKNLGADYLFDSIKNVAGKYELVIDTSASQQGLNAAIRALDKNGICSSSGIYFKNTTLPLIHLYMQGGTLKTGLANARPDAERCLELINKGMDLGLVTSKTDTWENADEAFMQRGHKIIVHRARTTAY